MIEFESRQIGLEEHKIKLLMRVLDDMEELQFLKAFEKVWDGGISDSWKLPPQTLQIIIPDPEGLLPKPKPDLFQQQTMFCESFQNGGVDSPTGESSDEMAVGFDDV
ncbi:hypothetical protein BGZ97_008956 [Linnemannia gamsii]|uniref:Uncharacterized protein n=1 Tax=Linnemannia gamsii TaxID=64522 RepID=A0A9P6UP46_9FUNG|nr:hypothetical protein BGZ97_008956 [Linnemannia gamsii]